MLTLKRWRAADCCNSTRWIREMGYAKFCWPISPKRVAAPYPGKKLNLCCALCAWTWTQPEHPLTQPAQAMFWLALVVTSMSIRSRKCPAGDNLIQEAREN